MIATVINTIRQHLNDTTQHINIWFEKPEDLRKYRPINGGWTINEILEHIALTSHFLLKLIDKGGDKSLRKATNINLEDALKDYQFEDDKMTEIGLHKSFVWIRPEHMEPKGEISLSAIKNTIHEQNDRCLVWLDRLVNGEGVLIKTTMTVNNLGKIDVYQYIYFLSQHAQRHIAQMQRNEEEYHFVNK
jgi:hypothetical protein